MKYLFTVPEGEKITEKHLTRVLVSSICSILLCISCLVSTTWAWFAVSVENTGNVITVGSYSITTTVTSLSDGKTFDPTSLYDHGYYLPEGEYSVKVELQEDSVAGYCKVYVNNDLLGTLVLDQATRSEQDPSMELIIKVNEAVPVMTITENEETEPMPNLVIVPTWGRTDSEDILASNTIQIGEIRSRMYAVIINNEKSSLSFYGINQADIFFEMLIDVQSPATRGLAMFDDIGSVKTIGSVRSVRYNFTDLSQAYGSILVHASRSDQVMQDLYAAGIENLNVDGKIGYRDEERKESYAREHCLFVTGKKLAAVTASAGWDQVSQKNNGLTYAAAGNTNTGVAASQIEIGFAYGETKKTTTMVYNNGQYEFYQYGEQMVDGADQSVVSFSNVIVLRAEIATDDVYYVAELTGSGTGYFAYGGKIVSIQWSRAKDADPFTFTLEDGTPLILGEGNTYVAIVSANSPVNF